MNKVFNINLGGYPFTIDEDAFEHLNRYLDAIKRHFKATEGRDEILNDIETRMAELLQERLNNRSIVSLKDVREVIVIMGTPEEFGAEPIGEGEASQKQYKTGKKLYRNTDDEVVGGVCSGIAAYFGIQDPVWVRLFFVIFTLSGGFGVPLYIILWSILPKAETASDRLSMRGEPINFSTIGKIIQEEFLKFSEGVSKFGEELSGKASTDGTQETEAGEKKKRGFTPPTSTQLSEILSQGFAFIGQVAHAVFNVLEKIWKPVLIIIGIIVTLSFIGAWGGLIAGMYVLQPFFDYIFPGQATVSILALLNVLFIIAIPFITVILFISKHLFGTYVSVYWRIGLGVFWWINLTSLAIIGGRSAQAFQASAQVEQAAKPLAINGDTLKMVLAESPQNNAEMDFDGELIMLDEGLAINNVRLSLAKSKDGAWAYTTSTFARGDNRHIAEKAAEAIKITFEVDANNQLVVSPYYLLPKGKRWKGQNVEITLFVPEGKYINWEEDVYNMLNNVEKASNAPSIWENPGKTWQMSAGGLNCIDCQPAEPTEE